MAKSSSIYTRVEPEIKEKAEQVLSNLGIPVANAINLFLHQVVLQQGIPFDVKLPKKPVLDLSKMTEEQLNTELQKGYDDLKAGRVMSSEQVREKMQGLYGI